ncbi:Uncharacterised protein [Campylobacter gracilis]|nr:Uncharacterised protein [Campylobacter gracilis]
MRRYAIKFHAASNGYEIYRNDFINLTCADRFCAGEIRTGKISHCYKYFKIPPKRAAKAAKFKAAKFKAAKFKAAKFKAAFYLDQRQLQHLFDPIYQRYFQIIFDLVRDLRQVALVVFARDQNLGDFGFVRGDELLLKPADRQHFAA